MPETPRGPWRRRAASIFEPFGTQEELSRQLEGLRAATAPEQGNVVPVRGAQAERRTRVVTL